MGLFNSIRMGSSAAGDYTIDRSLRFNGPDDTTYLQRTYSSAGNRRTFTLSVWMKRPKLGRNNDLWTPYRGGDGSNESRIQIQDDDQMRIYDSGGSSGYPVVRTKAVLRDTNAWYHLVYAIDTTQATDSNRVKLYINGVHQEVDTSGLHQWPNQNIELGFNNNHYHRIGAYGQSTNASDAPGNLSSEYLAELYVIDGQQLTPATFAETNADTGQWMPKNSADVKAAVTFGTNGFYLNFSDNSDVTATTLGKDYSGNGNNWTPYNFSVSAGIGNDSLEDTPTNNFPTLNSLDVLSGGNTRSLTISEGALKVAVGSGGEGNVNMTTVANIEIPTSGKWYWEVHVTDVATAAASRTHLGIINQAAKFDDGLDLMYADVAGVYAYAADGTKAVSPSGTMTSYGASYTDNDIIGFAVDADNGSIAFYKNGVSQGTAFTGLDMSEGFMPVVGYWGTFNINFGQRAFDYTVPAGYKTLCSNNLAEPSILLPNKHFDTLLWSGNSTNNRAITGLEFQPDFVWMKKRTTSAAQHSLVNSIVGTSDNGTGNGNVGDLDSSENRAEAAQSAGGFESFDANGFTLGKGNNDANADSAYQLNNASSMTYVGWNWKGGGSASSNGNGSITSSVSANTTAGFSIVTYTGTGSDATVGHGLGVAPEVVMVKCRNDTHHWRVYFSGVTNTDGKYLSLDSTIGVTSGSDKWNGAPTSSVFGVSGDNSTGGSLNYVAYCFSEVAGYSKFGSYTTHGNSGNGPFIYLGFRPAFFMHKRTDDGSSNSNWRIWDTARVTINPVDIMLQPDNNSSDYESNNVAMDFVSNGVKVRATDTGNNVPNGGNFIYFAFAESPFKYSRAR